MPTLLYAHRATGEYGDGKQRLGVNLISLIAALREEARLPFRTIQWYLDTVHGLRLSLGAIVDATQRVARKAQAELTGILERIRGSPVVHADETGWREDGHNGYVWTFSTPTERYFLRRGRGKAVVDEVLGDQFAGVLVSDFYAAYHHYDGSVPSSSVKARHPLLMLIRAAASSILGFGSASLPAALGMVR